MKNKLNLAHRGLAVLTAFVMCLGMLSITAFAAEDHEHNSDGWSCKEMQTRICEYELEHQHTDACYERVLTCGKEEHRHAGTTCGSSTGKNCDKEAHEHTDDCYEVVLTCTEAEHTHTGNCYTVKWECVPDTSGAEEPKEPCVDHIWRGKVKTVAPTCTEPGKTIQLCDICGAEITTIVQNLKFPATGHDYGEWETTKEATCEEDGEQTRVCANDSSHIETRVISANGHNYGDWEITKEATETEPGERSHTCTGCGHTETEEIPATGSSTPPVVDDGSGVVPTPPTPPVNPAPVDPAPVETEIEEPDTPLVELPEEIEIEEPDTPLVELPEEIELEDPDVPLADVPQTGDYSFIWEVFALISGAALVWLVLDDRKRRTAE